MAAYDLSSISDEQLEAAMDSMVASPWAHSEDVRKATVAEYNRRKAARTAAAATPSNVDANLDAAATPIAVEPTAGETPRGWRDLTDEEVVANIDASHPDVPAADLAAYGERYRQGVGRTIDRGVAARQAAREAGYQDADQDAYNAATGLPDYPTTEVGDGPIATGGPTHGGRWVRSGMGPERLYGGDVPQWAQGAFGSGTYDIDGVTVPTFDLGDGKQRYSLRSIREAKDAAHEAKLAKMFSESAQQDLRDYGDRPTFRYKRDADGNLVLVNGRPVPEEIPTSELVDANGRPDPRLVQQQDNLRKRRAMEARQNSQNAALRNRPGLRQYEAEQAAAKDRYRAMAMLAGGSQNINSGNRAMLNALVELDPDERQAALRQMLPMDPVRAQVEARQLEMAARLAGDAITGAVAGQGVQGIAHDQARRKNAEDGAAWFETYYNQNHTGMSGSPYDEGSYRRAVAILRQVYGLDPATAEAIAQSRGVPKAAAPAAPHPADAGSDPGDLPTTTW